MTIFDASVLVDALVVAGPAGNDARQVLHDRSVLHVPSIFAAEVTSAIRSMQARGDVSLRQALGAVSRIKAIRTVQYPFEPFIGRVWELRDNLTVYDGWYVALAESLDTSLVTADRRLAQVSGPRCPIVVLDQFAAGSVGPPPQRSHPPRRIGSE